MEIVDNITQRRKAASRRVGAKKKALRVSLQIICGIAQMLDGEGRS